jgi:hypothetical protein
MPLEWTAGTLRLSLFFPEAVRTTVADWSKVTGQDEPETIQNAAGRRSMIGPFHGGILQMNVIGPRIDCILLPKAPNETVEEGYVPTIGTVPKVLHDFVNATAGWLGELEQPLQRIAVAGTMLAKCENLPTAYATLIDMLRTVHGDPHRMKELVFRINWPRNSTAVNGLSLNRITTWSVIQIQLQILTQSGPTTVVNETPATIAIRLEFDHNTDAERIAPFDRHSLVPIYRELVALALENAEKGEVL